MTVVRIKIKKFFTQKSYSFRQPANVPFASEYLVQTDVPFPSGQFQTCALNIAQAESRLHPDSVRFESATVKLATPNSSDGQSLGRIDRIPLRNLRGTLEIGEDEALAFPPVVGVYVRGAEWGTGPTLTIPYVITGAEWNLYIHKRVLPLRFQNQSEPNQTEPNQTELYTTTNFPFGQELLEAIRPINGQYVLLSATGDDDDRLRKVRQLFFRGFRLSSVKPKKKPAKAASRRFDVTNDETEINSTPTKKPKQSVEGVVYMLQGGGYFKIGKSINPDKRLTQIKLQIPFKVEVVHIIRAANPAEVESHWHRRFASRRQNGEWFLLTEAEVNEFKSVSNM